MQEQGKKQLPCHWEEGRFSTRQAGKGKNGQPAVSIDKKLDSGII